MIPALSAFPAWRGPRFPHHAALSAWAGTLERPHLIVSGELDSGHSAGSGIGLYVSHIKGGNNEETDPGVKP